MTKTTTTCDGCRKEINPDSGDLIIRTQATQIQPNGHKAESTADFCSRSCLFEYLKPKTETTP